jgi:hypothetical protein
MDPVHIGDLWVAIFELDEKVNSHNSMELH